VTMAEIVDVTDQNFESEVLKSDKPVIIDFWAEWCAPCKQIAPVIKELAEQYGDRIKIAKMDIDSNPGTPGQYGIRAIPTILSFKDGQVVEEFVRFHPAFAYMRRTATRDTELSGAEIKAGDKLALWYVSGNRDEKAFDNPDYFDVRRDPNPHQGFGGGGRHFCLGAGLARLELKLWIEETLKRFETIEPDGECERLSSTFLNQWYSMPVRLT